MAIGEVAVQDIWLIREGGESGPAEVVVYVQMQGKWYEAIREHADSSFSHNITANGLVSKDVSPVHWLNNKEQSPESKEPQ